MSSSFSTGGFGGLTNPSLLNGKRHFINFFGIPLKNLLLFTTTMEETIEMGLKRKKNALRRLYLSGPLHPDGKFNG